ncbi:MAG: glycoside hydrolase family 20 zincin-like fold domain-containing protein [Isosphaeraceae bacterium]
MNRCALLAVAMTLGVGAGWVARTARGSTSADGLQLLPYPRQVKLMSGRLRLGPPDYKTAGTPSKTEQIARESLARHLPRNGPRVTVRMGSLEEGCRAPWLTAEEMSFLKSAETSPDASVLTITPAGIAVVGKGKWGMLHGVQTVNQLAIQAAREGHDSIPCLNIRDWPDAVMRCLAPQLAWYAGWSTRREGYDNGNWSLAEWKWMVDWTLLHKCNAWAVCMYGNWPFTLPGYEADTLDFDSFSYDTRTGQKTPFHYTHRNIKHEFLPELIRHANERGIQVYAYIGKNTFNGTYIKRHPEADARSLVAEALPFTPGVHEYWSAFVKRILEQGFNGFVLEDPETYHVPNQNLQCYQTFWGPWARKYGFHSVAETNRYGPPLGVHVEYYTWLTREFDRIIRDEARKLNRSQPALYLISHILLDRIMKEVKGPAERAKWMALIDQKHGRKIPFILSEDHEKEYVGLLGKDRAITLGGRGGAAAGCFRIANINNDRMHGDLGMDLAEERAKQRRMIQAGGLGSMAYIFQWTNTEVFGYLGAQYLWRQRGVPGINNDDDFGFLEYAYRIAYGDEVGTLVGKAYGVNSCVSEFHVYEDDPPLIFFGGPLHRDFQLLSVMADQADSLARRAYLRFAGRAPDLYRPAYDPDAFRWDGYDLAADTLFKTERLRQLCVSTRRSRELCTAAFASRKAKQMIVEGGSIESIRKQLDAAVTAARTSELLYFANYEDDFTTGDDGTRLRKKMEAMRSRFLADCGIQDHTKVEPTRSVPEAVRQATKRRNVIDWEKQTDVLPAQPSAAGAGLYLSTDIGLSQNIDYYCLGAVFTVQVCGQDGRWRSVFRRSMLKKDAGWQHWDIPVDDAVNRTGHLRLRLITDAYSRAIDRNAPTWKWGYWGQPRVVLVTADGRRETRGDLIEQIDRSRSSVQLDDTGMRRAFDGRGEDSTGATFKPAGPGGGAPEPVRPAIMAFAPHRDGKSGVTVAEFNLCVTSSSRREDNPQTPSAKGP